MFKIISTLFYIFWLAHQTYWQMKAAVYSGVEIKELDNNKALLWIKHFFCHQPYKADATNSLMSDEEIETQGW